MNRIERLRDAFLRNDPPGFLSAEAKYLYARAWAENRPVAPMTRRMALSRAAILNQGTPAIDPDELIVGKPNYRVALTDEQRALVDAAARFMPVRHGQEAHMAVDYEKLLRLGAEGVIAEIEGHLAQLDPVGEPGDIEKEQFYGDCLILLRALNTCAARYAECARAMAEQESDAIRREELAKIALVLDRVPRQPARTFYEAVQSVHFLTFAIGMDGLYQLGRPDQYLLPYYEADVAAGQLTREQAQELIDCLCMLSNEYTPKGLAVGLMVGGRYPDGRPVINDLTYLFIRSIEHVRLSYPGVGLCVTRDTPDDLMRLACEVLSHGHTHPALFNDDVIQAGLRHYGLPKDEAASYIHSTCVEITPIARSSVWVASPYFNLLAPLLDAMGVTNDQPADAPDFESLIEAFKQRMAARIREAVREQNLLQLDRSMTYAHPLVSCFVDDCLARGLDLDRGGARYAFIESSFVGMANLADALTAVKALVYDDKRLTMAEFSKILKDNYQGHEPLRQMILSRLPKYGNDQPEADALVKRLSAWIADEMTRYKTFHHSRFIPSMFCWVMHERLGRDTPASPDGRPQGFPLGDGSGPAQGREHHGPTASILSSTCWPHEKFIGGIAVNLKFSHRLFTGESLEKMVQLARVYMQRGGFELQINVVDRDKLLRAQQNPDQYRDLVVRIGGYSDYFVNLSPEMQQEVLLRTEHEL